MCIRKAEPFLNPAFKGRDARKPGGKQRKKPQPVVSRETGLID
jgi:hypothetical protein